jgi:acetolactate synthase-1/2/3 large subunit
MGIGAIPGGHRLCTGLIGMHGTVASNKAVQSADLLIAVGARFSDRVTSREDLFARKAKLLHLDIDPAEINKNRESDCFLIGNVKESLSLLLDRLGGQTASEWNGEIEKWKSHNPGTGRAGEALPHPRFIIEESAKALGADAVAVTDVGQHQIWAAQFFPVSRPRGFISSGGLGAMGFGLGAAVGASLARDRRPVILFCGDGGFRMNSGELATAAHYGIPLLIIIFNNGALGMIRQWQDFFFQGRHAESSLPTVPDLVRLAGAYGLSAWHAATKAEFRAALGKALAEIGEGRPALIDVSVSASEKVLPMVPRGRAIDEQIV